MAESGDVFQAPRAGESSLAKVRNRCCAAPPPSHWHAPLGCNGLDRLSGTAPPLPHSLRVNERSCSQCVPTSSSTRARRLFIGGKARKFTWLELRRLARCATPHTSSFGRASAPRRSQWRKSSYSRHWTLTGHRLSIFSRYRFSLFEVLCPSGNRVPSRVYSGRFGVGCCLGFHLAPHPDRQDL